MAKKFGTFKTIDELNRAAAAQKEEGDLEALRILAEENGLSMEDVEDYLDSEGSFVTPAMAAIGKLALEEAEIRSEEIVKDWVEYIRYLCWDDSAFCEKVFSPEKTLKECVAADLKWSFEHAYEVDERKRKSWRCRSTQKSRKVLKIPSRSLLQRKATRNACMLLK